MNVAIGRGRDAVPRHELLGERLRAFELRAAPATARSTAARAREAVDDAGDERQLGTDDVRSTRSRARERDQRRRGRRPRSARCAPGSRAVPALPGATSTSLDARATARSFQASACSRPPLPTTRTFIGHARPSMPEVPHAGEHHRDAVLVGGARSLRRRASSRRAARSRVTPRSAAASTPSRNGKNASDASTAPCDVEARFARP